jgi:hypothetical protein
MERQEASGVASKNLPVTTRFLLSGLTRSSRGRGSALADMTS